MKIFSLRKKKWIVYVIFLLIFFYLSCFITYPLIFNLGRLSTGFADELLIAWIQNWNIHTFLNHPSNILGIFNTNSFYPYLNTLAYSETFLTSSILSLVPIIFIKEPIAANNFTIISSLTLLGFFSYILSFYITKKHLFSFLSGILIQFSPAILDKIVHIQVLTVYFFPLSIYFLLNFLKTKKYIYYLLFLLILLAQIYNSFLPGYYIIFSSLLIILFFILKDKKRIKLFISKKIIFSSLILVLLILPVITPYYFVSSEFKYTRDLRDSIHLALQPEDLISTNSYSKFNNIFSTFFFNKCSSSKCDIKPGFIGGIFSILSVFSIFYLIKNWKKEDHTIKGLTASAILGIILSLGPFLHLFRATIHKPFPIPLPYSLFYFLFPGFNGFRNSSRFEILFILTIAILIAYVLKNFFKKTNKIKLGIISAVLILGIIYEFNFPINFYPILQKKDFPKVYTWLDKTPKETVIIEMPIFTWNMQPYVFNENWRLYYSTVHFRNMINGASGFSPFPWQDFVIKVLREFPSNNSILELKKRRVDLIIFHKEEYDNLNKNNFSLSGKKIDNGKTLFDVLIKNPNLKLIKVFNQDYVFRIK